MQRYSGFGLFKHSLSHHENWQRMWRTPTPKKVYDVVIVGGGGHGLATAYYLAKEHGITNVGAGAPPVHRPGRRAQAGGLRPARRPG
ncbi:hypothetical protein ACQKQA_27875, partial [Pseudomonas sp. NPDC089530]